MHLEKVGALLSLVYCFFYLITGDIDDRLNPNAKIGAFWWRYFLTLSVGSTFLALVTKLNHFTLPLTVFMLYFTGQLLVIWVSNLGIVNWHKHVIRRDHLLDAVGSSKVTGILHFYYDNPVVSIWILLVIICLQMVSHYHDFEISEWFAKHSEQHISPAADDSADSEELSTPQTIPDSEDNKIFLNRPNQPDSDEDVVRPTMIDPDTEPTDLTRSIPPSTVVKLNTLESGELISVAPRSRLERFRRDLNRAHITKPVLIHNVGESCRIRIHLAGGMPPIEAAVLFERWTPRHFYAAQNSKRGFSMGSTVLAPWLEVFSMLSEVSWKDFLAVRSAFPITRSVLEKKSVIKLRGHYYTYYDPTVGFFMEQLNEFLIFKHGAKHERLLSAFSFNTGMPYDITHSASVQFDLLAANRINQFYHRDDVLAELKRADSISEGGVYYCDSCESEVVRRPRLCRVCKRLDAEQFMASFPPLSVTLTTHFCSRRCLKKGWNAHKRLHRLAEMYRSESRNAAVKE